MSFSMAAQNTANVANMGNEIDLFAIDGLVRYAYMFTLTRLKGCGLPGRAPIRNADQYQKGRGENFNVDARYTAPKSPDIAAGWCGSTHRTFVQSAHGNRPDTWVATITDSS